jgi:preprotein translocase subunit SecG
VDILLLVLHVFLSLGIITLVLLQKGSGATAGAAFGGGGAGSLFGAPGSANFLSKTTAIFAICFFINSMVLAYLAANRDVESGSVLDAMTAPVTESASPAETTPAEDADIPQADAPEPMVTEEAVTDDVPPAEAVEAPPADVPPATE